MDLPPTVGQEIKPELMINVQQAMSQLDALKVTTMRVHRLKLSQRISVRILLKSCRENVSESKMAAVS